MIKRGTEYTCEEAQENTRPTVLVGKGFLGRVYLSCPYRMHTNVLSGKSGKRHCKQNNKRNKGMEAINSMWSLEKYKHFRLFQHMT